MQDEIQDVRARPSGRALRRVLPVGLLTMLARPVLIVWEVYALLLMGLVALLLVQVVFFGFGDSHTSGTESPSSAIRAPTSAVVSSG